MADKIFDSGVLPEIAVTDTTPLPTINESGLWTKITGLGIKNYLGSVFVSKTGNETIAGIKTFSSSPIVPDSSFTIAKTTGLQTALDAKAPQATTYTKIETDIYNPDFYQYSIVRTVASGNLTVALKNYEGNDPTPTKPVKIMIGGVVRTITSALSITYIAGAINYLNLGSAELATKEVDLFAYLIFNTNISAVQIAIARLPFFNKWSDTAGGNTANEKDVLVQVSYPADTNDMVNIGRFNAILSAGFAWSIPATSDIRNYPIYETNPHPYISTLNGSGGSIGTFTATYDSSYTIRGRQVFFAMKIKCTNVGSWTGNVIALLPMVSVGLAEQETSGWFCANDANPATESRALPVILGGGVLGLVGVDTGALAWGTFVVNDHIRVQGFYNI